MFNLNQKVEFIFSFQNEKMYFRLFWLSELMDNVHWGFWIFYLVVRKKKKDETKKKAKNSEKRQFDSTNGKRVT